MSDERKVEWEANLSDASVEVGTSKSWERKKTLGQKEWQGQVDLKSWFSRLFRRGRDRA